MANKEILDLTEELAPADADVLELQKAGGGVGSSRRVPISSLGGGDVGVSGTPVNNQLAVWTDASTIEGDVNLTFDTGTDTFSTVNISASGTLSCTGAFTSLGIDDNCTIETLELSDGIMNTVGAGAFTIRRSVSDKGLVLSGGTGATSGANLTLNGNTEVPANKVQFRSGGTVTLLYDDAVPSWDFQGIDNLNIGNFTSVGIQDDATLRTWQFTNVGLVNLRDANSTWNGTGSGSREFSILSANTTGTSSSIRLHGTTHANKEQIWLRYNGSTKGYVLDGFAKTHEFHENFRMRVGSHYEEFIAGESLVNGDYCRMNSSAKMVKIDASAEATATGIFAVCTETLALDAVGKFNTSGRFTTTGLTAGSLYYASTTSGAITATAPSSAGEIVRLIGQALSTTVLFINAGLEFAEI